MVYDRTTYFTSTNVPCVHVYGNIWLFHFKTEIIHMVDWEPTIPLVSIPDGFVGPKDGIRVKCVIGYISN